MRGVLKTYVALERRVAQAVNARNKSTMGRPPRPPVLPLIAVQFPVGGACIEAHVKSAPSQESFIMPLKQV